MIKLGVLGAGHLGRIHLKLLRRMPEYELVGFFDPNKEVASFVEKEYGISKYESTDLLLEAVEAVDIVVPTLSHYECAEKAIKKTKHIFIEKPVASTLEEAKSLQRLAEEAKVKVQVGHVERFNPAYIAALPYFDSPMFIESHRLSQFNPRGTDVSVILDLMIHDIDIVLHLVKSSVKRIHASGVPVISKTPDIANARIEFNSGCVANLTASRISLKNMRKTRYFQKNAYIAIDMLEKKVDIFKITDVSKKPKPFDIIIGNESDGKKKQLVMANPSIHDTNAIQAELAAFAHAIEHNTDPVVTINDGYRALEIAYQVMEKINLKVDF